MKKLIRTTRNVLMWTEYCILMVVFIMLVISTVFIVIDSVKSFYTFNFSVLPLLSNALLLLVVKEVIWTVFRFFNKERFSLSPFLYIGVISCVREILFLSIENSIEKDNGINFLLGILINAAVILFLVTAYYLFKKARIAAGETS